MHRSTSPRSVRSVVSRVLATAIPLAAALCLSACCTSWEGDQCGVMDPDVTECPSQEEFAAVSGGEVKSGPDQKYYIDMRSDAEERTAGLLCCYRVKHESCNHSIGRVY